MSSTLKKSLSVGKFVDTKHVNTVIRNYKQERWIPNSARLGKEDSLSVWYSVEELEGFLAKVKDQGGDGVRLYFGAYDKDYTENPVYAGRQTVVFVATKQKETLNGSVRKDIYLHNGEESTILAYNAGSLCPPFCTTDDPPGIGIFDKGEDGMIIA